jgi:hypothetical protein
MSSVDRRPCNSGTEIFVREGMGGHKDVKNSGQGWEADFPIIEEVEDYAGRPRRFVITCHDVGLERKPGSVGIGPETDRPFIYATPIWPLLNGEYFG